MIAWFKRRRRKKEIDKFEKILSEKLGNIFPTMKELREHSKLVFFNFSEKPSAINFIYSMNPAYLDKHGKKHRVNFKVDGFEIKKKDGGFVKIPIKITHDLLGTVEIDNANEFWENYETTNIKIGEVKRTDLEFINEDEKKLRKIFNDIEEELKNKIQIEDTFEIELNGKKFYTIIDMEDGNYIGVNSKGQVYRLNHDSDEQAKLIHKSAKDFLINYSGNKKDVVRLFD